MRDLPVRAPRLGATPLGAQPDGWSAPLPGGIARAHPSAARLAATALQWMAARADLLCLVGICFLSLALGLLWLETVPFAGGPDEPAHYQMVRFIELHGRLPVFRPGEMWLYRTDVGMVESYAAYPPLAYVIAAVLAAPAPADGFWWARAVSLASIVGTALLTFLIGRRLFPGSRSVAVCASILVTTLPKLSFTGAYVNNDALATFGAALMVYLLTLLWAHPRRAWFLLTGLVLGGMLLTKYTAYADAALGLMVGLALARRAPRPRASAGLLVGALVASSGWWFARNVQLYGEPIPGHVIAAAKEAAGGNTLFVAAKSGINLVTLSFETDFWEQTLKSFIAAFNWQSVYLDPAWYALYAVCGLVGLAGVVLWLVRGDGDQRARVATLLGALMLGGTVLSTMAINVWGEWSPQGRYLFPALVPIALGVALGWRWVGGRLRVGRALPIAATAMLALVNGVSLLGYAVPSYYDPDLMHMVVQVDKVAVPSPLQGPVTVEGWALVEGATEWRPFAPDVVARYRTPVSGVAVYRDGPPGSGTMIGQTTYGSPRRDVGDFYGKSASVVRVGYRAVLQPSEIGAGSHTLYICATATDIDSPDCVQRAVQVDPVISDSAG